MPIFDLAAGYNATPDIVVREADLLHGIGDAKYRDWPEPDSKPMHAEIYQLLAHAKAYGAHKAFLVYPNDAYEAADLGTSVTGCRVWAFAFNLHDMKTSAVAAASAMGF